MVILFMLAACSSTNNEPKEIVYESDTYAYQSENQHQLENNIISVGPNAPTSREREVLVRLIKEMRVLYPMIKEANAASRPDQRVPFQYDLLEQDFNRIQQGVQQYLFQRASSPRDFDEISGDYQ